MKCKKCGTEVKKTYDGLCVRCIDGQAKEKATKTNKAKNETDLDFNLKIEPSMFKDIVLKLSNL